MALKLIQIIFLIRNILSIDQMGVFVVDNDVHTYEGDILHQTFESPYTEGDIEEEMSRLYDSITLGDRDIKPAADTNYRVVTLQLYMVLFYDSKIRPNPTNVFNVRLNINGNYTSYQDIQFNYDENKNTFNKIGYTHVRRNYYGSQVLYLKERLSGPLFLEINYNPIDEFRFYYKSARVYASACHPSCSSCDNTTLACQTCGDGKLNNTECVCDNKSFKTYSLDMKFKCNSTNFDQNLCQSYDNTNLQDHCTNCIGKSIHKINLSNKNALYSSCVCPPNHAIYTIAGSESCINIIDKTCYDINKNSDDDVSDASSNNSTNTGNTATITFNKTSITYFVEEKENFNLNVFAKQDRIFGQMYFKLVLNVMNYPDYNISPIVFKMTLKNKGLSINNFNIRNDKEWVYNSYFPQIELTYMGGININLNDLKANIYDCDSNTLNSWDCNIYISAYHPCTKASYLKTNIIVRLTSDGINQDTYSLDAKANNNPNSNTLDIPSLIVNNTLIPSPLRTIYPTVDCLKENKCHYVSLYRIYGVFCKDLNCTAVQTDDYSPNDVLYFKTMVTLYGQEINNFSIEFASFITKTDLGNEVFTVEVTSDISENSNKVFLVNIPKALFTDNYLNGDKLMLNIIFKIDSANNDAPYTLLSPLELLVDLDPMLIQKQSGEKQEIIAKIALGVVITLLSFVILCIARIICNNHKRIKNNVDENIETKVIPIENRVPPTTERHFAKIEVKTVQRMRDNAQDITIDKQMD
jgi:hypothetical protein